MEIKLSVPEERSRLTELCAGDRVLISGQLYTARDAAHRRIFSMLQSGSTHDLNWLKDAFIYYTGPCPAPPGNIIGSCGPTTSCRMDGFAPALMDFGLAATIGKGARSAECIESIKKNNAVYFAAIGGAGAFYAGCVTSAEVFRFPELLSEAVYKLTVKDFPAVVAVDSTGASIY